jgi:hypothetical protein
MGLAALKFFDASPANTFPYVSTSYRAGSASETRAIKKGRELTVPVGGKLLESGQRLER